MEVGEGAESALGLEIGTRDGVGVGEGGRDGGGVEVGLGTKEGEGTGFTHWS